MLQLKKIESEAATLVTITPGSVYLIINVIIRKNKNNNILPNNLETGVSILVVLRVGLQVVDVDVRQTCSTKNLATRGKRWKPIGET